MKRVECKSKSLSEFQVGNVIARFEPTVDMKEVRKAVEEGL